ncbi:FAD-dependent oxidoreductase [Microbacterium sp. BWT-G7]|uniref:FAD-dependent oxidoreductase n=2 Tax=Microbacterium allomyrinae TaxID=2830666 RepID=A0A9X1LTV5_9MICO|nr:FAD-dependent oxidoreductase [Microbacterium allomyrinae]
MDAVTVPTPSPDAAPAASPLAAGVSSGASGHGHSDGVPGVSGRVGPASEPLEELVAHARDTRVVVIGGGIAGLTAAWECAKVGMSVTVVEASDRLGGVIGSAEVAGVRLETGATCWSTRGGAVRRLVAEVAPDAVVVTPRDDREWLAGLPRGAAAPLPVENVLGIPANAWDESVRRVIGWSGTWRAYVDRLRPPLTIGTQRSLGRLVRSRMGDAVLHRLVAPLSIDRFGLLPDDVDVEVAIPALSPALTRTGSLGAAVSEIRLDAASGPAIETIEGGMPQLVAALRDKLAGRGATIRTGARVLALARANAGWTIDLDADIAAPGSGAGDDAPDLTPETASQYTADAVIVATDEATARVLLASAAGSPAFADVTPAGIAREVVTLLIEAPALDTAPRGAHVHAIPGAHRAVGLVHETARWDWLARAIGPGRHVVRVAFGGPADPPATAGLGDADAAGMALAEASALLGVALDDHHLVGAHRDSFTLVPPVSAVGQRERAAAARAAIAAAPGIAAVGAWVSGSGLAQVVGDAQTEADRLRRSLIWRSGDNA